MGLIERIKSALGLGTSTSSPDSTSNADRRADAESATGGEPTSVSGTDGDGDVTVVQTVVNPDDQGDDVDVTVEHEPDTRSEDAVKGTDTAGTGTSADVEPAEEATDESSPDDTTGQSADTDAEADSDTTSAADLEEVTGIGPAYAGRLRDAGIDDVAALAAADATDLAERSDISEGRLRTFIDRAAER